MLTEVDGARGVASLRRHFKEGKAELIEHFRQARPSAPSAVKLIRSLARHVDATLAELWQHTLMPPGATLVAVGGYGRAELFPYSDVDVLVLVPDATSSDALRSSIEGFITACWDIGLEIGSSVRTLAECAEEAERDVTVQTALLEARFLCGSRRLYTSFRTTMRAAMEPKAFFVAKTLEMRQRHQKFEDTPYALEPNCKESPGGLRDLQILIWVARAAGFGRSWNELLNAGLITSFELKQLQRNEGLLKLIRARLHMVAGRREDRLVFDLQTATAESFGYHGSRAQRVSEVLMHRYYWAAKAVTQLNQIVLLNIEERIVGSQDAPMRPIDEHFFDRGGQLEVAHDKLYEDDPRQVLRTFLVFIRTPGLAGLSARTLRALYNSRETMDGAFRRDPVNRVTFMQILQEPRGQTHALRMMNQTSVLGRYLWVFRRIVGQMQHDLFHVYTVDQHILMVLRNVRRFFIPEHAHEYPFCSQLGASWDKPWLLYIAALFHDVAKGRGGDHSELGGQEVRRFCRDHGIVRDDAALCEFLVRHHLTMSRVAQKEDLTDPDVIDAFAKQVGSARQLTALYLLTVADIRGTSPKVWNAWKGKLLEDLYRAALRALGGAIPNLEAEIEARKEEARHLLAWHALPQNHESALWQTLEVSYFARHDANDIVWHARMLALRTESAEPIVSARPSSTGDGLQVMVYAPDQPDLFARICGYFDSAGFNILDARIHTSRTRYALDTFQITATDFELPSDAFQAQAAYRDLVLLVETQLAAALQARGPLPEPRRGRLSRRVRSFPIAPRVTLRPDERGQRFVLGISASDRAGLLYALARVLAKHHINLQLAKISTLGERVEDTFLIDGAELLRNRQQIEIETELLEAASL